MLSRIRSTPTRGVQRYIRSRVAARYPADAADSQLEGKDVLPRASGDVLRYIDSLFTAQVD
jgi:hypothetical protein